MKPYRVICFLLSTFLVFVFGCNTIHDSCVVSTKNGKVEGFRTDNGVYAFLGIPYAEPPKGDLRFAAPVEKKNWSGVLVAKKLGPSCPQEKDELEEASSMGMDEDCMTLNIWTPKPDNNKRPVIIWIHGGAFKLGGTADPSYNGSVFAQRGDIVFASVNYRVNAFGFLYLDGYGSEYKGSGCNGIRDQLMGITWIKNNISNFGGDPDNITIMGESAGSASVLILMGLPQSKGLFNKAIAESGGCNANRTREMASKLTKDFFEIAGVRTPVELKQLSKEQIVTAVVKQQEKTEGMDAELIFAPVIDGYVIPQDPLKAIKDGDARNINLLNGFNRNDFNYWLTLVPDLQSLSEKQPLALLPESVQSEIRGREKGIVDFYKDKSQVKSEWGLNLITGLLFFIPHTQVSEAQSKYASVWLYRFDWRSQTRADLGACHAIEIPFVFKTFESNFNKLVVGPNPPEKLSDIMQDAWIAFARTGNPNHPGMPNWPAYTIEQRATMIFNSPQCEVKDDPDKEIRELLEDYGQGNDCFLKEKKAMKYKLTDTNASDNTLSKDIFVDYEYGDLKEVIVGVPFVIGPDISVGKWVEEMLKVLPEEEAEKLKQMSGKDSISTGKYAQMEKENSALIAILEKHGVKVY